MTSVGGGDVEPRRFEDWSTWRSTAERKTVRWADAMSEDELEALLKSMQLQGRRAAASE